MRNLDKCIVAASAAAFVSLAALVAGCAGPTTRTAEATAELTEMASFEELPRERICDWVVRGKYTVQHCRSVRNP